MIHLELNSQGASALAQNIAMALHGEGLQISTDSALEVVATLMGRSDWDTLEDELDASAMVTLDDLPPVANGQFALAALTELATRAFPSFPSNLRSSELTRAAPVRDVPFVLESREGEMSVVFISEEVDDAEESTSIAENLEEMTASNATELGVLFATSMGHVFSSSPDKLDVFYDRIIVLDEDTGFDVILKSEPNPLGLVSIAFNNYAMANGMPRADDDAIIRNCGHLIFIKPYELEQRLFVLHTCDGRLFPARWSEILMKDFSTDFLAIGMRVIFAEGLLECPPDYDLYGAPTNAIVVGIANESSHRRIISACPEGTTEVIQVSADVLIPEYVDQDSQDPVALH